MLIKNDNEPSGLGYFLIDQRASDIPVFGGNGPRLFEADTYTCSHCTRVVVMNPQRKRERYRCNGCQHLICDDCAAVKFENGGVCVTMQQIVDEIKAQALEQTPVQVDSVLPFTLFRR